MKEEKIDRYGNLHSIPDEINYSRLDSLFKELNKVDPSSDLKDEYESFSADPFISNEIKILMEYLYDPIKLKNSEASLTNILSSLNECSPQYNMSSILKIKSEYPLLYNINPEVFNSIKTIAKLQRDKQIYGNFNIKGSDLREYSSKNMIMESLATIQTPKESKRKRKYQLIIYISAIIGGLSIPGYGFVLGAVIGYLIYKISYTSEQPS